MNIFNKTVKFKSSVISNNSTGQVTKVHDNGNIRLDSIRAHVSVRGPGEDTSVRTSKSIRHLLRGKTRGRQINKLLLTRGTRNRRTERERADSLQEQTGREDQQKTQWKRSTRRKTQTRHASSHTRLLRDQERRT